MPFTLFQGGSSLQFMETDGTITTLTLPTGVTIDPSKRARFTVFKRHVIVVNSPTRPLTVDADGVVRLLTPAAPGTPPTTSGVTAGSLSGTYLVRYSYVIFDGAGRLLSESELSPPSASITITSKMLRASNLGLSSDQIGAIRLYRTATGGSTYFHWLDLDGNTQTSVEDDLADASLSLVEAPILGSVSRLKLVSEFRERVWGVSMTDVDAVRYTESGMMYSWPSTNRIPIPREGADDRGVTAILTRRDALAIARQNSMVQITGNSNSDFRVVKLSSEVGVESTDSIAQFRDTIYFVGKDGVYSWDTTGINSVSDGKVRTWFTTDTYFNRERFRESVGRVDPLTNKYQLLLSAAGSTVLDRWIEYDLKDKTWWGPHKTDAFTPSWMTTLINAEELVIPVLASSSGFFFREQDTRTDDTATAIALNVDGKFHDMGTPDIEKYFGELAVISRIQAAGTLVVTPKVGGMDASAGAAISANMTLGRQRLRRLGTGRFLQLNFSHATAGQKVELFGYEVPFHELGRR